MTDERLSLDGFALKLQLLSEAPGLVGGAHVRAALLKSHDAQNIPLTSIVRVSPPGARQSAPGPERISLGQVVLVSQEVNLQDLSSGQKIWQALHSCVDQRPPDNDWATYTYSLYREHGRGRWGQYPTWHVQTGEYDSPYPGSLPFGPFLVPERKVMAETLADLCAWWTGELDYDRSFRRKHGIVIPDVRAYFERVEFTGDGFTVTVHRAIAGALHVILRGTDLMGGRVEVHRQVLKTRVTLRIPTRQNNRRLLLFDDLGGQVFDEHREDHFDAEIGSLLIGRCLVPSGKRSHALAEALSGGEGPTTEFKDWTDVGQSSQKVWEILETVVAFANSAGGVLVIGVDNHGDVVGTDADLLRTVRTRAPDIGDLREQYTRALMERITSEIKPRLLPEFSWVERDHKWVLCVAVQPRSGEPHFIEKTKSGFVRRGATNERVTPWDAARVMARSPTGRWSRSSNWFGDPF